MTSALPMMFSPVCMDDKCYIDGGTYTNYPLSFCIDQNNKLDEILGIKNVFNNECNSKCNENKTLDDEFTSKKNDIINNESSLLDFFISFFQKLILNLNIDNLTHIIKHEIYCECQTITHTFFNKVISSIETRKELLENGIECGNQYIQNISDLKIKNND
jgi:hypothetical protein